MASKHHHPWLILDMIGSVRWNSLSLPVVKPHPTNYASNNYTAGNAPKLRNHDLSAQVRDNSWIIPFMCIIHALLTSSGGWPLRIVTLTAACWRLWQLCDLLKLESGDTRKNRASTLIARASNNIVEYVRSKYFIGFVYTPKHPLSYSGIMLAIGSKQVVKDW